MFQCHVFRCDLSDAVGKIMFGFQEAFNRANRKSLTSVPGMSDEYEDSLYTFDVSLDIKEEDGKGGFTSCPQDNGVFKLRRDVVKTLYFTLTQTSNKEVKVERCFGVLVSPGRNIRNSDMHLIEMTSMGYESTGKGYSVVAEWNPVSENFTVLNEETAKDMRVFMTVAVDLVFNCIREPIRFTLETRAKVYPKGERFFFHSKKPVKEKYYMHLTPAKLAESEQSTHCEQQYELKSLVSETVKERKKALNLKNYQINMQAGGIPSPNEDEEGSDDESPMVSGSGHVSKEITDADLLGQWAETLKKWHAHLSHRPKQVHMLCRKGVPEALRGEDSPCTEAISRDMNRTFPAHEYFRDEGGIGQDSLYKLSKAYSVYDAEMPEEQAFSVLVKIMYDYHLRNFYKDGFQDLHLRFYQLERIFQNQLPDLYGHFIDIQLEAHMYASQWFLSMFTAKFPLYLVYRILDLFLCDGLNTVFSVALALLKSSVLSVLKDSRRELLALDFEGVLKFFRVTLPKKYRSEPAANSLLDIANRTKVSVKKLQKYEQEYLAIQAAQVKQEDPLTMYERDNKRLMETNMRLERENDSLAQELITSKVTLRNDLDSAEESMESLCKKLEKMSREFADSEEMVKRLSTENSQLKEKYRSEVCSVEEELKRNKEIIAQYKDICNSMSERNEKNISSYREELRKFKEVMTHCSQCTESLNITAPARPSVDQSAASKDKKIRELELELAQTKLALVQIECRSQEMSHELTNKHSELQSIKNNWWNKGLTTLREAVNKKGDAS
ncbi:RABGAP1 [Bugula neritina]|uniref:RABGAP1 n=1 Tax=Bugula neritina TaxID=10212 RepID=A0A7J7KI84_BUGNE|nr:RABGAP1 [Bugula neritina]